MSHSAETASYNPFLDSALMFGEFLFAGAAAMNRQVGACVDQWFDALAQSMRSAADLANKAADAETTAAAAAAGYGWFRAIFEEGAAWAGAAAARIFGSPTDGPRLQPEPPPKSEPQPVLRARPARIDPKPPAGKARGAMPPPRIAKKPSRTATR
jgi:hypothetical protein